MKLNLFEADSSFRELERSHSNDPEEVASFIGQLLRNGQAAEVLRLAVDGAGWDVELREYCANGLSPFLRDGTVAKFIWGNSEEVFDNLYGGAGGGGVLDLLYELNYGLLQHPNRVGFTMGWLRDVAHRASAVDVEALAHRLWRRVLTQRSAARSEVDDDEELLELFGLGVSAIVSHGERGEFIEWLNNWSHDDPLSWWDTSVLIILSNYFKSAGDAGWGPPWAGLGPDAVDLLVSAIGQLGGGGHDPNLGRLSGGDWGETFFSSFLFKEVVNEAASWRTGAN